MTDDLTKYIEARKQRSPSFAENYDTGYKEFEYNALLKQARLEAGLTQDNMAKRLDTKKSAISRII
ncbi:multiprotein-bridging factor 1 family protein [Faucicola mancuniensis]|uniref:helix-turn-helix domain-containing protein n=1 Tax=Faucicola mancuniensis TaxID=1309795 RepID=UPI003977C5F2